MLILIILTVAFLLASACFSGFENGMMSVRQARLDHAVATGSRSARVMQRFLQQPALMLGTILLGNNLANCFTAIFFDEIIGTYQNSMLLSVSCSGVLTVVVLVFGEVTPKVWFRQQPFARCQLLIYPIYIFHWIFFPFIKVLTFVTLAINRIVGREPDTAVDLNVVRDDFRLMLHESVEAELIDTEAKRLMENALGFHKKKVRDLMTPVEKVISLPGSWTLAEAVEKAKACRLSRFPVYRHDDASDWMGVFTIYDVLFKVLPDDWHRNTVIDYVRPLPNISEDAPIHQILLRSRILKSPMLTAEDANGRPAGVITVTDVVQPLFGDLQG